MTHHKYPDFVLHEGQDKNDRQELIVEVKTKAGIKNDNFLNDIKKLHDFTHNNKWGNFKAGLFIAVNMSNDDLKEAIDKNLDDIKELNLDKIYCICTIEPETKLDRIINEIESKKSSKS